MEKISWTDHVRNEEVLLRVNEQRNILHEIRKRTDTINRQAHMCAGRLIVSVIFTTHWDVPPKENGRLTGLDTSYVETAF